MRIDKGSSAYEFVVNPNGKRDTVWDGHSHAELRHQYYWGAAPFAWYDSYTHFQTLDYMGTARIQTSETGTVEGVYSFLPWGDSLSGAGNGSDAYSGGAAVNDAYHFAGLDHDYETDTDHAQFRQYSPAQGRWLSPDPYSGSYDFTNPQSLNRFSYVLNNPLSFTDPLGLEAAVGGGDCGNDPNCNEPGASGSGGGGGIGNDPFFGSSGGGVLGSLAASEEAWWLGSGSIPWYSVVNGNLFLLFASNVYIPNPFWNGTINPDPNGPGSPNDEMGGFGNLYLNEGSVLSSSSTTGSDLLIGAGGSGGGGAWYNNSCITSALGAGALSVGFDSIGLLPEGGAVSSAFSLWHGAAGISNGTKILERVQFGGALFSTFSAASSSDSLAYTQMLTGAAAVGVGLAKFTPVVGQVLSGLSIAEDLYGTIKKVANCH